MPGVGAVLGAVSAVAGIASTVSGLSSAAASKRDVRRQNRAAALANVQLDDINNELRSTVAGANVIVRNSVRRQNRIIRRTNQGINALNEEARELTSGANRLIERANNVQLRSARNEQRQVRLNNAQARRSLIRQTLRDSATIEQAAVNSGVEDSSIARGAQSSLQSQLASELGFQSRSEALDERGFRLSLRERNLRGQADARLTEVSNIRNDAVDLARRGERRIVIAQNSERRATSRAQSRIALLQNEGDRIREQASLDPRRFINENENTTVLPDSSLTERQLRERNQAPSSRTVASVNPGTQRFNDLFR